MTFDGIHDFVSGHQTLSALVVIGMAGSFGGFVFGISTETHHKLQVPIKGTTIQLGFVGDLLAGMATSYGVLFLVDSFVGESVDMTKLHELLRLISLSILSGFAGITLLSKASKQFSENISNRLSKIDAQNKNIQQELKAAQLRDIETQAEFFLREKKYEQAIYACDEMLGIEPNSDLALILKGKAFRLKGKLADAKGLLDTVIKRNPNNARAYYNRACYRCLQKEPIADILSDLAKAIEIRASYKKFALDDPDFDTIKNDADFQNAIK